MSINNDLPSDISKRTLSYTDCSAGSSAAASWIALDVIKAIVDLSGSCGAPAFTCTLMNCEYGVGIYFCNDNSVTTSVGCLGAGLLGSTVMGCITTDYSTTSGAGFDTRAISALIQAGAC